MAPQGDTKSMTLRIDETLAERVRTIAEVEETTVSDVIRDALAEHVERRRSDPGVSDDAQAQPSAPSGTAEHARRRLSDLSRTRRCACHRVRGSRA